MLCISTVRKQMFSFINYGTVFYYWTELKQNGCPQLHDVCNEPHEKIPTRREILLHQGNINITTIQDNPKLPLTSRKKNIAFRSDNSDTSDVGAP